MNGETNPLVMQEFKRRRKRQLILAVPLVAVMLVFFWVSDHQNTPVLGLQPSQFIWVMLAFVVFALAFSLYNWRCPSCNSYLGKRINPSFCSSCGTKLHD